MTVRLAANRASDLADAGVHDRHGLLPGFDQSQLTAATVDVIGAGAGSEIARALTRKGIGRVRIFDPDPAIEISNLPRQFFYPEQLGWPKAAVLPHNLAREATSATVFEGHAVAFEEAVQCGRDVSCTVAVVAVDSSPARAFASQYFLARGTPAILTAFATNADRAYVLVQGEAGEPCFGCAFPDQVTAGDSFPCAGATIDLPLVVAGMVAYAVDTLIMLRKRYWNYREVSLSGVTADVCASLPPNPDCPFRCGAREES